MPININKHWLPSFTFKYSNIQSNKGNVINSISIHGYTVNEVFISNKHSNYSIPATDPFVEASYFYSEKAAFLSLNNLNMNQYAYLEITSDTKEIDLICFDVYPFYPGKVPNHSLIPNKFMYHIMQTLNVTYKLTTDDINNKYYVIEIIKSKNANINFIIETYKETPLYKDDVNLFNELKNKHSNILVIVGPEGGFDDKEVEKLIKFNNLKPISLGKRILRTETAPLYIMSVLGFIGEQYEN
jgi:hypothetical protein